MALACPAYEKEVLAVHARLISLSFLSHFFYKLVSVQMPNQWQTFLLILSIPSHKLTYFHVVVVVVFFFFKSSLVKNIRQKVKSF